MLSSGGTADASTAARHGVLDRALRPRRRRRRRRARGRARRCAGGAVGLDMGGTSCDVSLALDGSAAVGHGPRASAAARWPCRWWTSTRSAPAAGRSPGATPAGRCAWARAPRAPTPVRPATAAAAASPTVTDANLVLGYLDAGVAACRRRPAATASARRARRRVAGRRARDRASQEAAAGIVRVADTEMAQAVRVVTVERGIDPRDLALVAFGGAGPLHAAGSPRSSGWAAWSCRPRPGVLSALGLVLSERRRDVVESVLLARRRPDAPEPSARRGRAAGASAAATSSAPPRAELRATYDLRYAGPGLRAVRWTPRSSRDPDDLRRGVRPRPRAALRLRRPRRGARARDACAWPPRCRARSSARRRARGRRGARQPRARVLRGGELEARGAAAPARRGGRPGDLRAATARRWWCRPAGAPSAGRRRRW